MLGEVNPLDARLNEVEAIALVKMIEKRESYVRQGRAREAHGLGTGIFIFWRTLIGEPHPATNFGEL